MELLGQRLLDLQLIRLIGTGARARVFLASDGEQVRAVKVFPADSLSHAEREYDLGRDLDHPNLNPVLEVHSLQGLPVLLMPFVRGQVLSQWIRGSAGPEEFLRLLPGLVSALAYLAERGIVHRDLKPENLIVSSSGEVTLLDYDIATRPGSEEPAARLVGTLAFLSPEQAGGQPVSPATDLYALGVLMYWGLCGEVPFSGEPAEVMAAHLQQLPAPVSRLQPDLAELDGLVMSLLAKSPEDRPDHREVARQLSLLY